jgi:hypothetical protein
LREAMIIRRSGSTGADAEPSVGVAERQRAAIAIGVVGPRVGVARRRRRWRWGRCGRGCWRRRGVSDGATLAGCIFKLAVHRTIVLSIASLGRGFSSVA